jgi:hypothetical protein
MEKAAHEWVKSEKKFYSGKKKLVYHWTICVKKRDNLIVK